MNSFAAVIREGSFTSAASQLRISRSLVTRHVAQLEQHLGTRLVNRTTQKISATEAGTKYYDFCLKFLNDLQVAESSLADDRKKPRGELRIMAPKSFGTLYLASAIAEFVRLHRQMRVSLFLDDQPRALGSFTDRGFDVAIRTAEMEDSSLVCRKIAKLRWAVCGTSSFLAKHGTPSRPNDLARLPCFIFGFQNRPVLTFAGPKGIHTVQVEGPVKANSVLLLRELALCDIGLIICPIYSVAEDLREGRLIEVLTDYSMRQNELSVLYARDRFNAAKISVFVDFLINWYANPSWNNLDRRSKLLR